MVCKTLKKAGMFSRSIWKPSALELSSQVVLNPKPTDMSTKREAAKSFLGDNWLLAKPINDATPSEPAV